MYIFVKKIIMETKHTKGEWKISNGYITCNNEPIAFAASLIKRVDETRIDGESWLSMMDRTKQDRINCEKEKEANAKLIAAAPDLLEALISIVNYGNENYAYHSDSFIKELKKCQNAINKATNDNFKPKIDLNKVIKTEPKIIKENGK